MLKKQKANYLIIKRKFKKIVMKLKRTIISVTIITAIVVIVVLRLASNKRSFDDQLKMISEFNTTVPVITDTVKYEQINNEFSVNGIFDPIQDISITSEIQGKIISIAAAIGDNVKDGQVLASIDNEYYSSQLDLAKFNFEKAEKDMLRYENLSKGDAVTMQQYESAKQVYENAKSLYTTAKIQFDNSFIKAPFDGIITKSYIEKGSYISLGVSVFDIVSINKVKFIAKLKADEVGKVQKGQTIKINVDNYPGISYEGVISAIVVKSDLSKRYDVEVEVINQTKNQIKPGMFGTALFVGDSINQVLAIPRKALTGSIKSPEVFIVKGDSVILQNINAIPLNDKDIAVTQGLKAGDIIIVSGQINLVNGSKIKLNK